MAPRDLQLMPTEDTGRHHPMLRSAGGFLRRMTNMDRRAAEQRPMCAQNAEDVRVALEGTARRAAVRDRQVEGPRGCRYALDTPKICCSVKSCSRVRLCVSWQINRSQQEQRTPQIVLAPPPPRPLRIRDWFDLRLVALEPQQIRVPAPVPSPLVTPPPARGLWDLRPCSSSGCGGCDRGPPCVSVCMCTRVSLRWLCTGHGKGLDSHLSARGFRITKWYPPVVRSGYGEVRPLPCCPSPPGPARAQLRPLYA